MNRVCTAHEKFSDWQREAKGQDLYAAYYLTLGLTAEQRKDAERELIKKYDPPCNILLSPISGIAAMLKPHGNK
jgi:hypothetical protein